MLGVKREIFLFTAHRVLNKKHYRGYDRNNAGD